ncbi:MAG: hypothetical protein XXXJIFNMEKO3_01150 [Candidatus Erwinia impunctatus]|nr:hypothetical protein XXXJIFNMEKO_01150 [Culicoides impunctatus]
MAIPKSVANGMISGVVGEVSHFGPLRATSAVLDSADEKRICLVWPIPTKMPVLNLCSQAVMGRLRGS